MSDIGFFVTEAPPEKRNTTSEVPTHSPKKLASFRLASSLSTLASQRNGCLNWCPNGQFNGQIRQNDDKLQEYHRIWGCPILSQTQICPYTILYLEIQTTPGWGDWRGQRKDLKNGQKSTRSISPCDSLVSSDQTCQKDPRCTHK
jgi:hypothetical protein